MLRNVGINIFYEIIMIVNLGTGCLLFPFQVQIKQLKYLQEEWFVLLFVNLNAA